MKLPVLLLLATYLASLASAELFTKEHKKMLDKLTSEYAKSNAKSKPVATRKQNPELERTERVNRGFERMIQFVNVLGQVDNFISDRTKNFIRKLNAIYDVDETDSLRKYRTK